MKLSTQIKHFLAQFGNKARVKTGLGKGQWINAWIPCDRGNLHTLTYSQPAFPLELRVAALKIVYPNCPDCWSGNAGNVRPYDIALRAPEWITLMETYDPQPSGALVYRC